LTAATGVTLPLSLLTAVAELCAAGEAPPPVVAELDVVVAPALLVELDAAVVGVELLPPPQAANRAMTADEPAPAEINRRTPRRLILYALSREALARISSAP